jgi:hypothetical protein
MTKSNQRKVAVLLRRLDHLRTNFAPGTAREKRSVLDKLRRTSIGRPSDLLKYHDLLSFYRAYPDNKTIMSLVEREFRTFRKRVDSLRSRHYLDNTGIIGTTTRYSYSFEMVQLLQAWYSRDMAIDWKESPAGLADDLLELIPHLVSWHEHDGLENDAYFDIQEWLRMAGGRNRSDLYSLVSRIQSSELPYLSQRLLFDELELSVRWELGNSDATRTLKRVPCRKHFFQTGDFVRRSPDLKTRLEEPAAPFQRLSRDRGMHYVRAVNEVLATRNRELYPITLAIPEEVYLARVGRGVEIAIFGSKPVVRLPLESNFGALLTRNGLPVGYGVGAVLFDRVEIAINVFPAFRGAESAYIIEEFFRIFYHRFGSRVLLVRSMQMGHGEEEALLSGAFWFYYKLGFRALNPSVRKLAEIEREKMNRDRRYRCSVKTMQRLANTDVVLCADGGSAADFEELSLTNLGYTVTRYLARTADGDRMKGEREAMKIVGRILGMRNMDRWTDDERMTFARMAPLVASIKDLRTWSPSEKAQMAKIIRAKGSTNERDYILRSIRHARFRQSLERLARAFRRPN